MNLNYILVQQKAAQVQRVFLSDMRGREQTKPINSLYFQENNPISLKSNGQWSTQFSKSYLKATLRESLENMILINTIEHPTLLWKDRVTQYPSSRISFLVFRKATDSF